MKSTRLLCPLLVLAPLLLRAESFPELEPPLAQYTQDRKTLDDARARQVEAAQARYLTALATARGEAAKANKGGTVNAIDAEIAQAKSEVHAAAMPADLPHSLATARREFLTAMDALEKATAARMKDVNGRYLKALTSLEQTAASRGNAPLTEAIQREKTRLSAANPALAAPALRHNAILNGDFSKTGADNLPVGWQPKGTGYQKDSVPWQSDATVIQEGSEKFLRFRRTSSVRLANLAPVAPIAIPERAKFAVLSVRLRVEGLVAAQGYDRFPGATIRALDATGATPGGVSASATENTRWRNFTARLTLQPGAKTLEVSLGPWAATGICDFDDVEVKFE
jgi:hypothetical protein